MLLAFLAAYLLLQTAWDQCRGTALQRVVIDGMTVRTNVALINFLTPHIQASAQGSSIVAVGGGINVRSGCEGTELLFLLIAALIAFPFSRRVRWVGIATGIVLVFLLNQVRLLALFYSFRSNPVVFGQIHGLAGPLGLVIVLVAFFVLLLRWDRHRHPSAVQ